MVLPQNTAGLHTDCENVIGSCNDIDDTFMNDRLGLARILGVHRRTVQPSPPDSFQVHDVLAIDLGQRRVVLVEEVASALEPAIGGKRGQIIRQLRVKGGVAR